MKYIVPIFLSLALMSMPAAAQLMFGKDIDNVHRPLMTYSDGSLSIAKFSSVGLTQAVTSNNVKGTRGDVYGFYVNSTTAGTIRFWDESLSGTCDTNPKGGTITPAIGWHFYPTAFSNGICVLTGGTIDVTVMFK